MNLSYLWNVPQIPQVLWSLSFVFFIPLKCTRSTFLIHFLATSCKEQTFGNLKIKFRNHAPVWLVLILLMDEILHHLGCIKPYKQWDIYHINWCRILSINSIMIVSISILWKFLERNGIMKSTAMVAPLDTCNDNQPGIIPLALPDGTVSFHAMSMILGIQGLGEVSSFPASSHTS